MTHMELPEVLVLAHQVLQLFLKIQPVDQPYMMRGHGLRHSSSPWSRPGVFIHRPWEACPCSLLCRKYFHHLDPPSLSSASSSSNPHPQYYQHPQHIPAHHPHPAWYWALGFTSVASVCSSLPQSGSSGQKFAPCTPAAWSASWEEARQLSVIFSECLPKTGLGWGFCLLLGSVLAFQIKVLL